jgi:hypothetical protein
MALWGLSKCEQEIVVLPPHWYPAVCPILSRWRSLEEKMGA